MLKAILRDRHSPTCNHYVFSDRDGTPLTAYHQNDVDNEELQDCEVMHCIRQAIEDAKNIGIEVFDKSTGKVTTDFKIRQDAVEAISAEDQLLKAIGASMFGVKN